MTDFDAADFAWRWVADWNAGDVEAVLAHFHEDAVFSSPIALRLGHGEGGKVRGKDAIRSYWSAAMKVHPGLRFELQGVYAGVDSIVIMFKNEAGVLRAEVLAFADGLVTTGYGTMPCDLGR